MHSLSLIATAICLAAAPALAQDNLTAPPPAPFAKVSELVKLPDFLPGLGTLYVDPASLPAGPFLGYDHDGKLAATIYMIPVADLNPDKSFSGLPLGNDTVTSVDVYYNAGHAGVEVPHAHIVLWHDAGAKERVAQ
jgi:hypothetical protein